jgi:glycine/D-amino acid oxidase-like deaminating enzyme/nitrite reductase/ring-hydroxylating ferredoxin subunit
MQTDSGRTTSIWMDGMPAIPGDGRLETDLTADVCVVGAGIAGLSVAYRCAKEGRSVVVVDDGEIGGGMTSRTTAHLVTALDDRYHELERLHGEKGARLAAASHAAAIDAIAAAVAAERIDCEFEWLDGYLFSPPHESRQILKDEYEAARRAGLDVELVTRAPIADFDTGTALRFSRQAQFHPLRYLAGLTRAIRAAGGRVFTGSHVQEVQGGVDACVKTVSGFTVRAGAIVVATNTPVNDRVVMHTKQGPYSTYVIGAPVPPGSVTRALYWDTPDPYHYVRLAGDILIVGGEDHKTGQADDGPRRFAALERWARALFPMMGESRYRWSGEVMEPVDALAFIGRNPGDENVYIATGDSGNGMTHGTIAGILISDLIAGRDNAWAGLYDPARKSLRALKDFARENLNVAVQYKDLATPGDVAGEDEIRRGQGAVVRHGLKKVAVFRDAEGTVHRMSAVCPHLGCIVDWNSTEQTWDCPCHGSRFSATGKVFQGPANGDLDRA